MLLFQIFINYNVWCLKKYNDMPPLHYFILHHHHLIIIISYNIIITQSVRANLKITLKANCQCRTFLFLAWTSLTLLAYKKGYVLNISLQYVNTWRNWQIQQLHDWGGSLFVILFKKRMNEMVYVLNCILNIKLKQLFPML